LLLRHDMKPDRTGWTVHDVLAGRPICLGGLSLIGLSFEDANELVDMLNRQDREIDRTARQLVSTAAYRRDLPGEAPSSLAPITRFLAAIADDGIPGAVGLVQAGEIRTRPSSNGECIVPGQIALRHAFA
jgi:hypothetical protein